MLGVFGLSPATKALVLWEKESRREPGEKCWWAMTWQPVPLGVASILFQCYLKCAEREAAMLLTEMWGGGKEEQLREKAVSYVNSLSCGEERQETDRLKAQVLYSATCIPDWVTPIYLLWLYHTVKMWGYEELLPFDNVHRLCRHWWDHSLFSQHRETLNKSFPDCTWTPLFCI